MNSRFGCQPGSVLTVEGGRAAASAVALEPALQLVLLLTRLTLSVEQKRDALTLCSRIDDWPRVAQEAEQRFVMPLVYRHLQQLAPKNLPPEQLEGMRCQCLAIVQYNLYLADTQRQLVQELLDPLGIPYLFFKGHALAARYYDEPAMRFCRDIDLLVPHERIVELLEVALKQGYTPYWPRNLAPDRISLTFAARVRPVITLQSPQGIPLEIHKQIDKAGTIYDTANLVGNAEALWVDDIEMSVMPTAELFVYACLHHTRHRWSHLHWLADLDAIQRHPDFDLAAVRACAEQRNLTATLEASLELYQACAMLEPWRNETISDNGRALVEACLINLQGGREAEVSLRSENPTPDFAFAWQTNLAHRLWWRIRGWVSLLQPSYADYQSWPLRPSYQWLYLLTRPFRGLIKRLGSREAQ
ncbi:nucleotidyltransferase family protein [Litchfieldella rifensis]|uniref:Nucleotidyltransferase family protein n=1 Tax=Litchfieldella rifensis TaxID=762643 RepID=A0ABV7LUX6_9GAMM